MKNIEGKKVLILLLAFSLIFNVVVVTQANNNPLEKQYDDYGYVNYLLTKKLDAQSYIFHNISRYFISIEKQENTNNDLLHYLNGVGEFTKGDMLKGLNNIVLEDHKDISEVLHDITLTIIDTEKFLDKSYSPHYKELSILYEELSGLLNRNNKEKSLSYFISTKNPADERVHDILIEIRNILTEIKSINEKG